MSSDETKGIDDIPEDVLSDEEKGAIKQSFLKNQAAINYRQKLAEEYGVPSGPGGGNRPSPQERGPSAGGNNRVAVNRATNIRNTEKVLHRDKIMVELGRRIEESLVDILSDADMEEDAKVEAIQESYLKVFDENIGRVRESLEDTLSGVGENLKVQVKNFSEAVAMEENPDATKKKSCCGNNPQAKKRKAIAVIKKIVGDVI